MEKQTLSIEQMKHLQKLGLDVSDASMQYCTMKLSNDADCSTEIIKNVLVPSNFIVPFDITITDSNPVYTLQDIISKIPNVIEPKEDWIKEHFKKAHLEIGYCEQFPNFTTLRYSIEDSEERYTYNDSAFTTEYMSLLEASYRLLCWCIERKYININNK